MKNNQRQQQKQQSAGTGNSSEESLDQFRILINCLLVMLSGKTSLNHLFKAKGSHSKCQLFMG